MIALLEAYKVGLLKPKNWMPNLISGLIVGIVALPLAMAFAIASGVKPEEGLYTAIIAGIVVAVFGGSRVQIAGPTGAFVVILANITAIYGVGGLQLATLLAGFILLFMGFIRLGNVIKFIPEPVIVGFTAGIGFIIFVGQWKDFFGLTVHYPLKSHFHQKIIALIHAFPTLNWATTALSLLSIALVLITPKIIKRVPGPLIAMVVATALQSYFKFPHVATLGSAFGGIPQSLPHFQLLPFTLNEALDLIGPAFTIALLGAIESLLSASVADGMAGTRHQSNQELIGQGLANILAPLFGGFAATGAIARTATNIRNGGNSPLSAITHAVVLILIIVLFAPLAAYIPLCSLAAILFVVAYNMSDLPHFTHIVRNAPNYDVIVLLVTFLLTVFTDLVIAVNLGVILAILFFLRQMMQSVKIEEQSHEHIKKELSNSEIHALTHDTAIYTLQGPLFFGVAEKIEHALGIIQNDPRTIIFRLRDVPFIDMTGLQTFSEVIEQYHRRGVNIYLCEANAIVKKEIRKAGILKFVKENKVFATIEEILKRRL